LGQVQVTKAPLAWQLTFTNEGRRNAMTWSMYDDLVAVCDELREYSPGIGPRVLVLKGSGDAFIAGTDISQFLEFDTAEDGVTYERTVANVLRALLTVQIPVVGVVRGPAVGGGLAIAACCDVVLAADDAVFGVPIARTLGNCLSPLAIRLLRSKLGPAQTSRMLYAAEMMSAHEAKAVGFAAVTAPSGTLDTLADEYIERISTLAPLTLRALKVTSIAVAEQAESTEADDVIRMCYGSNDFKEGVRAFTEGRKPQWTGS
jgi:enoyl-CoA hydratase/carnithine racemase